MSQDSDVARVAAALRAPVIRYRNFGNGPLRNPPRPAKPPETPGENPESVLAAGAAPQHDPSFPPAEAQAKASQPMVDFLRAALMPGRHAAQASARPKAATAPAAAPKLMKVPATAPASPAPRPAAPQPVAASAGGASPAVLPPAAAPQALPVPQTMPASVQPAPAIVPPEPAPVMMAEPPPVAAPPSAEMALAPAAPPAAPPMPEWLRQAPPAQSPGLASPPARQGRQTAQSLLIMLRSAATQDNGSARRQEAGVEAELEQASLLEQLRASCAANPPPSEGLLAVLSQPAVWDLPLAAPAPAGPAPLVGRPIDPAMGGLLNLSPAGFGAAEPRPALPTPPPPAPAFAAPGTPLPRASLPRAPAPRPAWPAAPEPSPPAEPPPAAAPAQAAPASLAEVFRLVAAPPSPPSEPPKRTDSLKDILRGLRPDRRA